MRYSFSNRVSTCLALALAFLVGACGDNTNPSSAKDVTAFSFQKANNPALTSDIAATISGTSIVASVPFGTDISGLKATLSSTGKAVLVGGTVQVSGMSPNNFLTPIDYTVVAADTTTKHYTATITVAPAGAKDITAFAFRTADNPALTADVTATIAGTTIAATVPFGTDVTALKTTFSTTGTSVAVAGTAQVSGTTPNDFTTAADYEVSAADHTTKDYTVTVTIAPSSAKDITAFAFTSALNGGAGISVDVTGSITDTSATTGAIALTVPFATDVTALTATFSTTGTSVVVGATAQVSGTTVDNFTSPVTYTVTAADATTKTYLVSVTVARNPAKAITALSITEALNSGNGVTSDSIGSINETSHTINVTVPFGTNLDGLIATFTTTGDAVAISATPQVSGTTANDYSGGSLTYTVTADDTTTQNYTVTVSAALNPAKAITAYEFTAVLNSGNGVTTDSVGTIDPINHVIAVTVPFGTNLDGLIATFTTTGEQVAIGATDQATGVTANNFSGGTVTYTITAQDGTTQDYAVTVTAALNPAKDITAFEFTMANNPGLTADLVGVIDQTAHTITTPVLPFGTNLSALIATFTTTGDTVHIGGVLQVSDTTVNDFSAAPLTYTATADDTTTQDYSVSVPLALNPAKDITAFSFLAMQNSGLTTDAVGTISGTDIGLFVPFGTDVTDLIATYTTTGQGVAISSVAQSSGVTGNDFTNAVVYTVTAEDGTTKDYTVTVVVGLLMDSAPTPISTTDQRCNGAISLHLTATTASTINILEALIQPVGADTNVKLAIYDHTAASLAFVSSPILATLAGGQQWVTSSGMSLSLTAGHTYELAAMVEGCAYFPWATGSFTSNGLTALSSNGNPTNYATPTFFNSFAGVNPRFKIYGTEP